MCSGQGRVEVFTTVLMEARTLIPNRGQCVRDKHKHMWNNRWKSDELICVCLCVCVWEKRACFCLLWEAGTTGEGRGTEERDCGLVSFFHLKIRASPENKTKPNWHQRWQKRGATGTRNVLKHVCKVTLKSNMYLWNKKWCMEDCTCQKFKKIKIKHSIWISLINVYLH